MAELSDREVNSAIEYNRARHDKNETLEFQGLVGVDLDGYWGPNTVQAVADWQESRSLDSDGKIGPATYAAMRSDPEMNHSPFFPPERVVPPPEEMWGYDHCPDVYHKECPAWEETTATGSFEAGLCRLVSGRKSNGTFSRSPDSWISLDELSIGIAHWWSNTAPKILTAIAQELGGHAEWAWGVNAASLMVNENWIRSNIHVQRGKEPYKKRYDWLLSGWWEIAQHPDVVKLCVREWLASYAPPGFKTMQEYGWKLGTTLAGLIRLTNSRGAGGMRSIISQAIEIVGNEKQETKILETAYCNEALYDHPERWALILSMDEFDGVAPKYVSPDNLAYNYSNVIRVDGTKPDWCEEELVATVDCITADLASLSWPIFSGSSSAARLDHVVAGHVTHAAYIPREFLPENIEVGDQIRCCRRDALSAWWEIAR